MQLLNSSLKRKLNWRRFPKSSKVINCELKVSSSRAKTNRCEQKVLNKVFNPSLQVEREAAKKQEEIFAMEKLNDALNEKLKSLSMEVCLLAISN